MCPTDNSANFLSSKTIHDFLKIPTNKKSVKELSTPDGTKGQMLQDNYKDLTALIVDERSIVGSTTMGWMEFHCKYGLNESSKSWGGPTSQSVSLLYHWMKSYSVFEYCYSDLSRSAGHVKLFPLVIFYVDQSEPVY